MDWIVNRVATEEDLLPLYKKGYFAEKSVKKAWIVNDSTIVVQSSITHKKGHGGLAYNKNHNFIGYWDFKGPLGKAIKDFEFKSKLSTNTAKTFSDIIDEL